MSQRILFCGLAFLLLTLFSLEARAEYFVMPEELVRYARTNGCDQPKDFFKGIKSMIDPPYVYGYLPGPANDSAVFWCQTEEASKTSYWLLIMDRNKMQTGEVSGCRAKVPAFNPPKGLSVHRAKDTVLTEFSYLDEPQKRGPSGVRLTGNVITNESRRIN